MAETKPRRSRRSTRNDGAAEWLQEVQELSYQDARTALELAMAKLQSSDLEVEEMAGLYQRAEAYAQRCEAVLEGVEQQVIEWESTHT